MSEQKAPFIALEGVDNVGKSTVASQLVKTLVDGGPAPHVIAFPGNEPGSVGKWVYDLHHDPHRQSVNQTCLQLLHVAAHIDSIETHIKPLIAEGRGVVLDRYWWSTYAYGVAGGVDVARLEKMIELEELVWDDCRPDCIVLLRRRSAERAAKPALVAEYERLRARSQNRVVEVWNDADLQSVVAEIVEAVRSTRD